MTYLELSNRCLTVRDVGDLCLVVGDIDDRLADGPRLYVGGQIGWNKQQIFEHRDFIGQMEQALRNVVDPRCEAASIRAV